MGVGRWKVDWNWCTLWWARVNISVSGYQMDDVKGFVAREMKLMVIVCGGGGGGTFSCFEYIYYGCKKLDIFSIHPYKLTRMVIFIVNQRITLQCTKFITIWIWNTYWSYTLELEHILKDRNFCKFRWQMTKKNTRNTKK